MKTVLDPFGRVWEAFQRSATTADGRHDSLYWRSHAGPYAACLIRIPAARLEPALDDVRGDLSRLSGVRLHPDSFLHIMLQELGFLTDLPARPDEVSPARLEEFTQAAVNAVFNLPISRIELGGINSFQDAAFLEVHPTEPCRVIHERLLDLAAIPRASQFPYLPHCTIAHYDGTVPVPDALEILDPWRKAICGEIELTEIEIVTIDTSAPYPELESYAVIPFGP